jgi:hypothetical protein
VLGKRFEAPACRRRWVGSIPTRTFILSISFVGRNCSEVTPIFEPVRGNARTFLREFLDADFQEFAIRCFRPIDNNSH